MAKQAKMVERKRPTLNDAWKRAGFGSGMEDVLNRLAKEAQAEVAKNRVGVGAAMSQLSSLMTTACGCPNFMIPTVEQVSLRFGGPISQANATEIFNADFDIFNTQRNAPGLVSYESTFSGGQGGEPQQSELLIGYYHHISVTPHRFTAPVNAWTTPTVAAVQPASLDDFSFYDTQATGGHTPLGPTTAFTMIPGYVDWGNWLDDAFWYYTRAFNIRWNLGQHETMLDEPAIKRTFLRDNVQEGTGSSSQVAFAPYVAQLNAYYREYLATALIALKVDHVRYGLTDNFGGAGAALASLSRISRALEFIDVTYGGAGFRRLRGDLKGNGEHNRLTKAMCWPRGVPFGLKLEMNDAVYWQGFINAITADNQAAPGVIPQQYQDDALITATTSQATTTGGASSAVSPPEYTSDSPQVLEGSGGYAQRAGFKGGPWEVVLGLTGFPFPQNLMGAMCANPDLASQVEENANVQLAANS